MFCRTADCRNVRGVLPAPFCRWLSRLAWLITKRPHAIRFNVEPEIDLVGRQGFEIRRPIVRRVAVGLATVVLHDDHVLAFADVLGALEHHVFEKMREAGLALRSSREPALYVTATEYVGAAWSSERMTRSPFFSVNCLKTMLCAIPGCIQINSSREDRTIFEVFMMTSIRHSL